MKYILTEEEETSRPHMPNISIWKQCRHTLDGSQAGNEGGTAGRRGAGAVEASPLVHGRWSLNRDLMLEVCRAKCADGLENDGNLRSVGDFKTRFPDDRFNSHYNAEAVHCAQVPSLTGGQADAVSILEFKSGALEFAFSLLHVRLVFVELEDEDVQLPLQHVDLPLGQLLLPPLQQLLLWLLLQGGARQLLFSGTKLLEEAGP